MGTPYDVFDLANELAKIEGWPEGALDRQLERGERYGDVLNELGFDLPAETAAWLNKTPAVVADTIINTFRSAQVHGARARVAWLPGADYEATIAHVGGEVTILLRSPSPGPGAVAE